ncbi:putative peroxidase-related enzyme [Paenarthrobacter nicotinovorans]|uniref:peroxidase-related enzyme n=1 Tax=Paenarthrobacter nicotinovorans TaxID=29320 RepID=UPI00277E811C|nr:peroxidase-related enzyme [Paenarthrobacter nicotinovorans]MDP9933741.1 putative peroxidase-related enzyme [Paenarthrobacter nicotinovorans]
MTTAPTFHGRPYRGAPIAWEPLIAVPALEELTEVQHASLRPVQRRSAFYRMLALDPAILAERTNVDSAIFYAKEGLARGERELCAAISSMVTGCPICTSTHIEFAAKFTKRPDDVNRFLAEGIEADVDPRWNAITNTAGALAAPTPTLGRIDVDSLRGNGLPEDEILDIVHSTSFFAWANRLLLTLGQSRYAEDE